MYSIIGYVAKFDKWLDQKGREHTPIIGDQIDVDLCDPGWEKIITDMGYGLRYVAGQAKIVKKG